MSKEMKSNQVFDDEERHTPFQCEVCKKDFKYKQNLIVHQRIHSGRPYTCTANGCYKSYITSSNLKNHIDRVHCVAESHKCDDCNKVFQSKVSLKLHGTRVHCKRLFTCIICSKSFKESFLANFLSSPTYIYSISPPSSGASIITFTPVKQLYIIRCAVLLPNTELGPS